MIDGDIYNRVRYLPTSVDNTLAKLARLKVEAENLGVPMHVLEDPTAFSAAWDREVKKAKLEATLRGRECSMGVDHG